MLFLSVGCWSYLRSCLRHAFGFWRLAFIYQIINLYVFVYSLFIGHAGDGLRLFINMAVHGGILSFILVRSLLLHGTAELCCRPLYNSDVLNVHVKRLVFVKSTFAVFDLYDIQLLNNARDTISCIVYFLSVEWLSLAYAISLEITNQ